MLVYMGSGRERDWDVNLIEIPDRARWIRNHKYRFIVAGLYFWIFQNARTKLFSEFVFLINFQVIS